MESKPLVLAWIGTYNQENYIRAAIDGFLMQKTNFSVKLVITEDCSQDNTREICIEYKNKYPDIIDLILSPANTKGMIRTQAYEKFNSSGAKYIAFCDGDDYWTDPLKLQKQIDFLEANPDFAICFHKAKVIYENDNAKNEEYSKYPCESDVSTILDLAKHGCYIQTVTCVFKNKINNLPDWFYKCFGGDYALYLILTENGEKIKYLDEAMSVYRINNSSMWQQKDNFTKFKLSLGIHLILLDKFSDEVNKLHEHRIEHSIYSIIQECIKENDWEKLLLVFKELENIPIKFISEYFQYVLKENKNNESSEKSIMQLLKLLSYNIRRKFIK